MTEAKHRGLGRGYSEGFWRACRVRAGGPGSEGNGAFAGNVSGLKKWA